MSFRVCILKEKALKKATAFTSLMKCNIKSKHVTSHQQLISAVLFDHRWGFFLKSLQHPHKATLKTLPQQNEFKLKT